ncbi:hypothetical protein [Ktedonobacter sp. SOSP1-52]|uniref:hypothetical protein n=1 Tax=Ktedonobacter sp. SOSP1-52 TaxID=2778366 RepID=UPI001F229110|nr:hypothetical protein [Ktedonobacter sp. SOSP1-52]
MPATIEGEEQRLAPRSLVVRRRPNPLPGKKPAVQTARASQLTRPRAQRSMTTERCRSSRGHQSQSHRGPSEGAGSCLWARDVVCAAPRHRGVSGAVLEWSAH